MAVRVKSYFLVTMVTVSELFSMCEETMKKYPQFSMHRN